MCKIETLLQHVASMGRRLARDWRSGTTLSMLVLVLVLGATPARSQGIALGGVVFNLPAQSGQYLAVPNKNGLQGNPDYTLEAWVRPASYANFPCIFGNDFTQSFWLGFNNAGQLRFYPRGGASQFVESLNTVPLDEWTHVAVTYQASSGWAIFLHGFLDNSGNSITGPPGTSTDSLRIGADRVAGSSSADYYWQGRLDELRIWDRALTPIEILQNRFTGAGLGNHQGPRYAGLKAYWSSSHGFSLTAATVDGLIDKAVPIEDYLTTEINHAWLNGDFRDMLRAGLPHLVPMDYNVALELNGADDYVSIEDHDDGYGGGVTIEAWIHPYSVATFPTIAGRDYLSSFWFGLTPEGKLRFYPRGGAGAYVDGSATIPINRWNHVAASYDPASNKTQLYVNGQLDLETTAFAGPVGENGRDVFVGADNEPSGPNYLFRGMLDEVCITNGPLSAQQIRRRRLTGNEPFTARIATGSEVIDLNGVIRHVYRVHCGPNRYPYFTLATNRSPLMYVYGSHARLVLSGAPMFGLDSSFLPDGIAVDQYAFGPWGGEGLTAPDILTLENHTVPITLTGTQVYDVDVFVSLSCGNLSQLSCSLTSPEGTTVSLVPAGTLDGRSIQTVFNDESAFAMSQQGAPLMDGVRPFQPLSNLDGKPATGTWEVSFLSTSAARFAVWAVGLRVVGATVDVAGSTAPHGIALAQAGPEPVRGRGSVRFTLPSDADIRLTLFDVTGRRMRELQQGRRPAGEHVVSWNASGLPAGRYQMRLEVDRTTTKTLPVTIVR